MNITPVNISFEGRKSRYAKGPDVRPPRRDCSTVLKRRNPAEIRNEILQIEKRIKKISSVQAKYLEEIDQIGDSQIHSAMKASLINDVAYCTDLIETLKIRIAILKSQL